MNNEQFVKAQLCLFAWREAHEYGYNNMEAVLFVLRNRYRAGWGDWLSLLHFKHDGADTLPDIKDYDFSKLLQRVDHIFDGTTPDKMTDGALYYGDLTKVSESFVKTISRNHDVHPRVAVVGPVYFFR